MERPSTASPPPAASALTDTRLLQLSLRNAVASAAAGKATIAANNYALAIKVIHRKCFLLEELALLALAMGYEARKAANTAAPRVDVDDDDNGRNNRGGDSTATTAQQDYPLTADLSAGEAQQQQQQLVDPLANVGMLLPPGLDEDDYDAERSYFEQKLQREQHQQRAATMPVSWNSASSASPVSSISPPADDSTPGYDTATARWLACLLAKVHPDALPIATLEKICKVPLTSSLKTAASSPTFSGERIDTLTARPNNSGDATSSSVTAAPFSAPLSLLFSTLLWNVACALWNEGFIEDAHHWLSAIDVRRLWSLYSEFGRSGHHTRAAAPSPSPPFAFSEPLEEDVNSDDRACALSWPAVLAESCAADEPPSSRPPSLPSAARESQSGGTGTTVDSRGAQQDCVTFSPAAPQSQSGILLSALAQANGPLPMTSLAACFDSPAQLESGNEDDDAAASNDAAAAATQSSTEKSDVGDAAAAAANPETRTTVLASFVRRLARRASALRDLCRLMIACETAEDVFYVLYALSGALATQQCKHDQQRRQQLAAEVIAEAEAAAGEKDENSSPSRTLAAATRGAATTTSSTATTTAPTSAGGLSELLIIANLLIELFLTKRAQQLLLEECVLHPIASGVATVPSSLPTGGRSGGAYDAAHSLPHQQQQQRRHTDRAIRHACDEIVCTFTNGRCHTLYALEAYGIPPPCDGGSNAAETHLLAPELPYALVSNVLSSTLNYSTLYRFSKVYHGVMGHSSYAAAERHHAGGMGGSAPSSSAAAAAAAAAASVLSYPNRTRRATEEEKERRRAWTMPPAAASAAPLRAAPPHPHASAPSTPANVRTFSQSLTGELFGFVKKRVASWGNLIHASVAPESRSSDDYHDGGSHHYQDVRSSFSMTNAAGGDGSNKERVALRVATPWSAGSSATLTSNSTSLADASSTSDAYLSKVGGDAQRGASATTSVSLSRQRRPGRGRVYELKTRGVEASELMLPSSSSTAVSLLAEENELIGLASIISEPAATVGPELSARDSSTLCLSSAVPPSQEQQQQRLPTSAAPATVLHTPAAQLQSRCRSEAVSLRLLALLYRYPQLHALEPVKASHVTLVAKELNKALHLVQAAMRGRFGDEWWLQWRTRREGETQRYYSNALADAQRGGYTLSSPTTALPSPLSRATGAVGAAAVPEEAKPLRAARGVSAVQSDPFLLFAEVRSRHAFPMQERGETNAIVADAVGFDGVPPPSVLPLSSSSLTSTVLSALQLTRPLSMSADEALRQSLQAPGEHFTPATLPGASTEAMHGSTHGSEMRLDVKWDIPPAYTPEVSLDFSAFTTTSVETQESTRQLVELLQQREEACDDEDDNNDDDGRVGSAAGGPGVSVLSRACRRLLHNELPLLQQYSPWRVIYSTRLHGISLGTLFANCRREAERHGLSGYVANPAVPTLLDSKPMLLVLELPSSITLQFAEDDAGVREAWAHSNAPTSTPPSPPITQPAPPQPTTNASPRGHRPNRLFIGAFLSDSLRTESRRYYGNQDCFVFQLLVPGTVGVKEAAPGAAHTETGPQLRVHRASHRNKQFINCRTTSIVIGGGEGGSSIYLDDTLCHGATSSCATFSSPPLSTWLSPPCAESGVCTDGQGDRYGEHRSLCIMNVEVIVMDV
ncbi:TLD domain protein, conserved [Leishmania panamensis]|uniref:TLD domain protein, conserved n=1 Tax=Leishmania panamensis TaxID=5679 RepID=A0A088RHN7_LEIPA|nr:TLD domain protein, conserved [Leishmania panamensis]AIN95275.1 TLD domain protein, conserved [Leishmania panamensis]